MNRLSLKMILAAHRTFKNWFSATPVEYSPALSNLLKTPVILKHEFLQPCGSYKLRGFFYLLSTLKEEEKKQGVVLCDPHNGAISLAYAAHLLKIPCTIFHSSTPSLILQKKLASYQAELLSFEDESQISSYCNQNHKLLLSSYDDPRLLAGCGGSMAIELLKDIPQLKNVVVPLGQGDLFSGLVYYLKKKFPDIVVIGCELNQTPLTSGSYYHELTGPKSKKSIEIAKNHLTQQITLDHQELLAARKWLFDEHQLLVEPAAAIGAACCLKTSLSLLEGPTALILTGRSFNDADLATIL